MQSFLLQIWQDLKGPADRLIRGGLRPTAGIAANGVPRLPAPRGAQLQSIMVGVHGQSHLLEMIHALSATSRLTRGLDRWQKEGNEDPDDGDGHQQLD
jgi:hypothetical protein